MVSNATVTPKSPNGKNFKNILLFLALVLACVVLEQKCNKHIVGSFEAAKEAAVFYPPQKSPFKNSVGICFSVEQTTWFTAPSIRYNQKLQDLYTLKRLVKISKDFKLIRIYSFLIAGWESTGNLSPEADALVKLTRADTSVEAVIGTSNTMTWYADSNNVKFFVGILKTKFGSSVGRVKTIMIGNEVNCIAQFNSSQLGIIVKNFRRALRANGLNIPVTVSFNNLPVQSGDTLSDNFVAAVVNNWDSTWNGNKSFVFIDPYPDAQGIGNAAGVYRWQYNVTKYYQAKHPSLQIFIAETGAEGSGSNYKTVTIVNSVFTQLNLQYDSVKKVVPTFIFEAVNEPKKPLSPNQTYMGIYTDTSAPKVININLKQGLKLPKVMGK